MADPRDADAIRESFLTSVRGQFAAFGQRILTVARSFFAVIGDAVGVELEGIEVMAFASRQEAFPDTASVDGVLRHAEFSNVTRGTAVRAVVRVRITGGGVSGPIPANKVVTGPTGLVYAPQETSYALGSGVGYLTLTARDAGAEGNVAAGAVFAWQNGAPSGLNPTLTAAPAPGDTTHALVVGSDEEDVNTSLRERAIYFRKLKAQGGNVADWVLNLSDVVGVDPYVYPRMAYNGGSYDADRPGRLVAILLNPSPPDDSYQQLGGVSLGLGLQATYRRSVSDAVLDLSRDYIEGVADAEGRPIPEALQVPKHSAGIASGNYTIKQPGLLVVDVGIALAMDPGVDPWAFTIAPVRTVLSSTTTTLTLDNAFGMAPGSRIAVDLSVPDPGVGPIRGGFWLATVQSVLLNVVTLSEALPSAPLTGNEVRPSCGAWADGRRLVLGLFDHLGPGDIGNIRSRRFPRPADRGQDRLYTSRFVDALQELPGVSGVEVLFPAAPVTTPVTGQILVPGRVYFQPQT